MRLPAIRTAPRSRYAGSPLLRAEGGASLPAPRGGGRGAAHGRAGIPGAGGGTPGSARGLSAPARPAVGRRAASRRGEVGASPAAAGCGHRWAAAASGTGVRGLPLSRREPAELRPGTRPHRRRSRPSPSASASWAAAAPPPRSAGNFLPRSFFGRRRRSAPPTSSGGRGRRASPARGWSSGTGRRPPRDPSCRWAFLEPGRWPLQPGAFGGPGEAPGISARSPEGEFPSAPRFGLGPRSPPQPAPAGAPRHPRPGCPGAAWSTVAMGTAGPSSLARDGMGR